MSSAGQSGRIHRRYRSATEGVRWAGLHLCAWRLAHAVPTGDYAWARYGYRLPARLKSKAKVETVEGQFDQFVSLVDGVFGNFLPWLLRGLEGLKEFSSSESGRVREWALMATHIETGLAKRMSPDLVVEEAVEE